MRWLFRLGGAVLTVLIAVVVAIALIPSDKIADLAARQFLATTGRALHLTGTVRPSIWPQIGVTTGPVEIANADWSTEGPMLRAEGLSVGLDLSAALRGAVIIRNLELVRPSILLERAANGAGNWEMGGAPASAAPADGATSGAGTAPAGPQSFVLDHGLISGGTVRWIDHATGQRLTFSALDGDIRIPAFDGPADIALTGDFQGQRLALTASIATFSQAMAGAVTPVRLEIEGGGIGGSFEGRIGIGPFALEGAVDIAATDPAIVMAMANQPVGALPPAMAPLAVGGKVTVTPEGTAHLRQGRVQIGSNILTGAADFYPAGDRPRLVAQVTTDTLDLVRFSAPDRAGAGTATGAAVGASGWSDAPIDVAALGALDAEVTLNAAAIVLPGMHLGPTRTVLHLDAGRAVFDLREVRAYGGLITGEFVVNGRNGLSLGGRLDVADMALAPMLLELAGSDRLSGTAAVQVKFLAVGNSMAALMQGLSGQGAFRVTGGAIKGFDLAEMIRTLDAGQVGDGLSTVFDDATGSFTIAKGILSNADLRVAAPYFTATGEGLVDIGARRLDYGLTGTADVAGNVVTVPVRIKGPWADPGFKLDAQGVIDANFAKEKAQLQAQAQARLAKEAARLGVVAQPGESLEDAARRTVEEKAAAELGKLLTGQTPVQATAASPAPAVGTPAPQSPEDLLKGLLLKQLGN